MERIISPDKASSNNSQGQLSLFDLDLLNHDTNKGSNHDVKPGGVFDKSKLVLSAAGESILPAIREQLFSVDHLEIPHPFETEKERSTVNLAVPRVLTDIGVSAVLGYSLSTLIPKSGLWGNVVRGAVAATFTLPLIEKSSDVYKSISSAKNASDFIESGNLIGHSLGEIGTQFAVGLPGFMIGSRIGRNNIENSSLSKTQLKAISRQLGCAELIETGPDGAQVNLLSYRALSKNPVLKDSFARNIAALDHASSYEPVNVTLADYTIPVHNKEIAGLMKAQYSPADFETILQSHEAHRFWDLKTDSQTGFVRTSGAVENAPMVRQWVTDSVRLGDIQRERDPDNWKKSMGSLARFYMQEPELQAIRNTVNDPGFYRDGPLENGVAHVFMPGTLERDGGWFNNKRLESHGLALKSFSDTVSAGLNDKPTQWGLSAKDLQSPEGQALLTSTKNLAEYILAVNTNPKTGKFDFMAPSAGNWEELPFPGLSSDTEAMRAGLESYRNLLKQIDKMGEQPAAFQTLKTQINPDKIDEAIEVATRLVHERINSPSGPTEHPNRPMDSSLAFITTSTVKFGDTLSDVASHYKILDALSNRLVRENGIIRYEPFEALPELVIPDGYLGVNSWLLPSLKSRLAGPNSAVKFTSGHSEDTSTPQSLAERALQTSPEHVSQWPWVSTMADGYARQVSKLVEGLGSGKLEETAEVNNLIWHGKRKSTEFLNRSLARTTGISEIKPNGYPVQGWVEPEAYEFVRTLDGRTVAMPGVNTPLAWAHASRYSALRSYEKMLKLLGEKNM